MGSPHPLTHPARSASVTLTGGTCTLVVGLQDVPPAPPLRLSNSRSPERERELRPKSESVTVDSKMEVSVPLMIRSNDGGDQTTEWNACVRLDIEESICVTKSKVRRLPFQKRKSSVSQLFRHANETSRRDRTAEAKKRRAQAGGGKKMPHAFALRPHDPVATHTPAHSTDYWDDYTHEPTTRGNGGPSQASGEWKEAVGCVLT